MHDHAEWSRLRDRLLSRGRMPALPEGWSHESAMLAAYGFEYGGDFIVSDLSADRQRLQLVLVDVCGGGESAVPAAVQFAGALESLIVAVPDDALLTAANAYLQRQPSDEDLATAVQVVLDLATGEYLIRSAGHPPALRWSLAATEWVVDNARGTALGVCDGPEFGETTGVLAPGEALTDAQPPATGATSGSETNGGRAWTWARRVTPLGDAGALRIDIAVAPGAGRPIAQLMVVRPGA